MLGKLWRSENHEELQSPCKKLCFKDRQQKPKPLGPWGLVPGTYCFAGERVGCQSSGAAAGPEHPHQAPGERELRGMHWQRAGIEQVPRSYYQPDIWAGPAGLGQPQLLVEAGCNRGSSEGRPFFPMLLQGLPSCWPGWETQHLWVLPQGSV